MLYRYTVGSRFLEIHSLNPNFKSFKTVLSMVSLLSLLTPDAQQKIMLYRVPLMERCTRYNIM